jgi:hypothetical protein
VNEFIEYYKSSINNKLNFSKNNLMSFVMVLLGLVVIFSLGMGNVAAAGNPSGNAIYVNTHGNDTWNGQSATHQTGTLTGPKLTIKNATGVVNKGGTVNIANGLYKGSKNNNITINKNMNIVGQSKSGTIISGSGTNWIFYIPKGVSVTISNLSMINGTRTTQSPVFLPRQDSFGGAIYNTGGTLNNPVTITNSNFEDNSLLHVGDRGGAICNTGFMSIINSSFEKNSAYIGGAIDNDYGTLNVIGSLFTNNTALFEGNGGAINNYGTLNITKGVFTGNQAGDGTVYSNNILNINYCTFTNNKGVGTSSGGAIESFKGNTTVSNSTFKNNSANEGGAIHNGDYHYAANLNIYNDIFTGNKGHYGGAIENLGTLTVDKSTFTDNTVTQIGGAIYNSGTLIVKRSTLTNNIATADAGAIYNGGTANIHFNRIIGNNARFGKNIFSDGIKTDATLNWWGSNAGPLSTVYKASGTLNVSSWLVLTVKPKSNTIPTNNHTTITADLLHDNHGVYHNPSSGYVPNGIPVTFTTTLGTINSPTSTSNGCAQSTLKSGTKTGNTTITAKIDNQTVKTIVTIKK